MKRRADADTAAKTTIRGLTLESGTDAYGTPFGVLHSGSRHTVLVTITDPASGQSPGRLLDRLPAWTAWLEVLGLTDRVCGASMSIETWAEGQARATVGLSLSSLPIPDLEPKRKRLRDGQMRDVIGTHLGALLDGLRATSTGLDVHVCTAQDITDLVRVAFDATIASDVESARAQGGTGLSWADAPPRPESVTARAYGHDRAVSMSWAIAAREDEPDVPLDSTALMPTPEVLGRRVTRIFRITPTPEACLRLFGAVVTVDGRAGAESALEAAAALPASVPLRARLRLRAATDTQDTTFLAGLPLDLATPHTTAIPSRLKETA